MAVLRHIQSDEKFAILLHGSSSWLEALLIEQPSLKAVSVGRTTPSQASQRRTYGLTYGGIVEELMLRYGLLTLGFWVVWKLSGERPRAGAAWALIAGVAVLFGLGHLPAMAATIPLDMAITLRTVALNAVLGVFYGWLYWRRGLEAGMMAHAATHPGLWIGLAIG
ncbi:CPBP family intramembrane glutamic endopeptidase [Maritimibacter harenae]|nr:CPBP family intramembrane glutamic endopeptidase [Maritimibacter harenae]